MLFADDRRAQSTQLGVLFVGAFIILAIATYQAQVVPDQTQQIESDAYLTAQQDLVELRGTLLTAATTRTPVTTSVLTGATYPHRAVFVNPPPPSGQLTTQSLGPYTVANASAVDAETREFWDGSTRAVTTHDIVFTPDYNQHTSATPLRFTSGVVYINNTNNHALSRPLLVSNNHIQLVSLTGNLSAADSDSVNLEAVSQTRTRTITVTNTSGPVTLFVPTTLPASKWRSSLLAEEYDGTGNTSNAAYIDSITDHPTKQGIRVTLEPGAVYQLTVMQVHVSEASAQDSPPALTPAYMTGSTPTNQTITTDATTTLQTEVRDKYNQPRSNVNVTYTITEGAENVSLVTPSRTVSDEAGQTTVMVEGEQRGQATIMASFGEGTAEQSVRFQIAVRNASA